MSYDKEYVHKCEICGKVFDTYPAIGDYVYKIREKSKNTKGVNHIHWFCGWNCQMKYEKTHDVDYKMKVREKRGKIYSKGLKNK